MVSESQRKAAARYDAKHTVAFKMKLNKKTDADILVKLDEQDNKQGYVKGLIRKDIAEGM